MAYKNTCFVHTTRFIGGIFRKDEMLILVSDEDKTIKRNKILAIFQLCLADEVFIEVACEKSTASLSLLLKLKALNHYIS